MGDYDIVTKAVAPSWVLATVVEVPDVHGIVAAHEKNWPRLHAVLDEFGVASGPHVRERVRRTAPIPETRALRAPGTAEAGHGRIWFGLAEPGEPAASMTR